MYNIVTSYNVNNKYIITSLSSYLERLNSCSLMRKFQGAVCRVMHRNKAERAKFNHCQSYLTEPTILEVTPFHQLTKLSEGCIGMS